MKAEITLSQLWFNSSLMSFFMRSQASDTLEELVERYGDREELFDEIEESYEDLDELEEDLYNMSADEFAENISIEISEEDEDDEEDEFVEDDEDE